MNFRQLRTCLALALVAVADLVAQKPIKVACVGNSITAGYLLSDPKKESYPSILQSLLGTGYEVGNFGHSGATLLSNGHRPYIQTEEFKKAVAFDADIVILHLGLNDTDPRNWPNYAHNFQRDYLRLLDTLGLHKAGKQFYIATMSPLLPAHKRYYTSSHAWFKEVNQVIERMPAEGVHVLNFSAPFTGRWHLFPDALHPNAEGARLLAEYVYHALKPEQTQGITLHPYYRDNMILQRGKVQIHGRAMAGHSLKYQVGHQASKTVQTDEQGYFVIHLDCPKYIAFDLKITDEQTQEVKTLRNVQIGEVWVASGQSNMAMTLGETKDFDLEKAPADPLLQYVDMQPIAKTDNVEWSTEVLDAVNAYRYYKPYRISTAQDRASLPTWSAVAYNFGRKLRDSLNCPVAIIHNAIGGSPIESWLDPTMLEEQYPDITMNWMNKEYTQDWAAGRAKKNIAQRPNGQTHPYAPGYLYMAGWEAIKDIPHRGVIWYQGESNAHAPERYAEYFRHLLDAYGKAQVEDKQTNVYAVQLSSINRPSWVYFRTRQADPQELYVPSYDLGDSLDVHPRYKALIGARLALRALERTYKHDVRSATPYIASVQVEHSQTGETILQVNLKDVWYGLKTTDGEALRGFELLLGDGRTLKVDNITLEPISKKMANRGEAVLTLTVPQGRYVALSYANEPYTRANVMGGNGMPLLPAMNLPIKAK